MHQHFVLDYQCERKNKRKKLTHKGVAPRSNTNYRIESCAKGGRGE